MRLQSVAAVSVTALFGVVLSSPAPIPVHVPGHGRKGSSAENLGKGQSGASVSSGAIKTASAPKAASNLSGSSSGPKAVGGPSSARTSPPGSKDASPKGASSSPKGASSSPKGASSSPKGASSSPKGTASSPKGSSSSPKDVASSPKGASPSPKGASPSPKGSTASPKAASSAPKGAAPGGKSVLATRSDNLPIDVSRVILSTNSHVPGHGRKGTTEENLGKGKSAGSAPKSSAPKSSSPKGSSPKTPSPPPKDSEAEEDASRVVLSTYSHVPGHGRKGTTEENLGKGKSAGSAPKPSSPKSSSPKGGSPKEASPPEDSDASRVILAVNEHVPGHGRKGSTEENLGKGKSAGSAPKSAPAAKSSSPKGGSPKGASPKAPSPPEDSDASRVILAVNEHVPGHGRKGSTEENLGKGKSAGSAPKSASGSKSSTPKSSTPKSSSPKAPAPKEPEESADDARRIVFPRRIELTS